MILDLNKAVCCWLKRHRWFERLAQTLLPSNFFSLKLLLPSNFLRQRISWQIYILVEMLCLNQLFFKNEEMLGSPSN